MQQSKLSQKAKLLVSLFRKHSDGGITSESRASERQRRVALSGLAAGVAKGASLLTALISVPLTYGYLGEEQYGLWMIISSVLGMMAFADLGLGNSLVNRLAEAYGKDDLESAKKFVSTAFFLLSAIAMLFGSIFFLIYPMVPWGRLFNVTTSQAAAEAGPATIVFAICFLLNLPLGVAQRIQIAFQEGFVNSMWSVGGNILGLGGVLLAIKLRAGLPWLVLAMAGGPVLATVLNLVSLFFFKRQWLMPSWRNVDHSVARSLLKVGMMFLVLQMTFALAFTSDNIVAAHVLSAAAVAEYALVLRLFMLFPSVLEMFIQPLWPAYGEAIARKDFIWIRKTLVRSLILAVGFVACVSTLLVLFGEEILSYWTRNPIKPTFGLLVGAGVWTVLSVAGSATAAFLNGTGSIRFQAICAVAMSSAAVISKVYFGEQFGLSGIIWGTILAYVVFTAIPMAFFVPRLLRHMAETSQDTKTLVAENGF